MDETDDLTDLSSTDADFIEFNVKLYFCVPTVVRNADSPRRICHSVRFSEHRQRQVPAKAVPRLRLAPAGRVQVQADVLELYVRDERVVETGERRFRAVRRDGHRRARDEQRDGNGRDNRRDQPD